LALFNSKGNNISREEGGHSVPPSPKFASISSPVGPISSQSHCRQISLSSRLLVPSDLATRRGLDIVCR